MDKTVPAPAARLLDFIGSVEAPAGYDTLYGNAQKRYSWRLTQLPIGEVLKRGPGWTKAHGSSACGRYQFMAGNNHTLKGLDTELGLNDNQIFNADLQDRLGYHLLIRRKYHQFMLGSISLQTFALYLAQEWASMPVLAKVKGAKRTVNRGQSYYAGDGLNHALVSPERMEAVLTAVKATPDGPEAVAEALRRQEKEAGKKLAANTVGAGATTTAATAGAASVDVTTFDWTAWLFVGGFALLAAVLLFFLIRNMITNAKRVGAFKKVRQNQ